MNGEEEKERKKERKKSLPHAHSKMFKKAFEAFKKEGPFEVSSGTRLVLPMQQLVYHRAKPCSAQRYAGARAR